MGNTTDKIKEGIKDTAGAVKRGAEKAKDAAVRGVDKWTPPRGRREGQGQNGPRPPRRSRRPEQSPAQRDSRRGVCATSRRQSSPPNAGRRGPAVGGGDAGGLPVLGGHAGSGWFAHAQEEP